MKEEQVRSLLRVGETIHLTGYTSTTKNFEVARNFAFADLKEDRVAVIYQIDFKGTCGLFEMTDEYTAYPGEGEVLVQDGLLYKVTSKDK